MAWLAMRDPKERRFSLRGLGHDRQDSRRHPPGDDILLARGSLVLEMRQPSNGPAREVLGFYNGWPRQSRLSLQALPGGRLSLAQVQGEQIAGATLAYGPSACTDLMRITYAWDAPAGWARLSVDRPGTDEITAIAVDRAGPIVLRDLREMLMGRGTHAFEPEILFAALSDQIEPIGPMPTLDPHAMIATPTGYRAANTLQRGDTVLTAGGTAVPVLQRIDRVVPARGSFAPLRLRAPYFGLQQDVIVAADQRIIIGGSEVEYLFGQETVLVPARHLVNGFSAVTAATGPTQRYTQLLLPDHRDALVVAGAAMERLYIGRMRRRPNDLAAGLLKDMDRSGLPEHEPTPLRRLIRLEATHLARQRAA